MSFSRFDISLVRVSVGSAAAAGVLSFGGLAFATLDGWPVWARGVAAVLPWLPVFAQRTAAIYHEYQWLALFYALVVTQTAHFLEHVAQMVQIHVLGLNGADARGIFGALDIEWVHFIWNTWVLLAVLVLLSRFGSNRWLWLTAVLSGWHEAEHAYIFSIYLATDVPGTPGLLSHGGVLGGGLPVSRPDLHVVYNLIETVPLVPGFLAQIQCTLPRTLRRHGRGPGGPIGPLGEGLRLPSTSSTKLGFASRTQIALWAAEHTRTTCDLV